MNELTCCSILLVEDNPMDIDLTQRAFAKRRLANPLEVDRDGEEALARMARWEAGEPPPLVILLDLKLPSGRPGGLAPHQDASPISLHPRRRPHDLGRGA